MSKELHASLKRSSVAIEFKSCARSAVNEGYQEDSHIRATTTDHPMSCLGSSDTWSGIRIKEERSEQISCLHLAVSGMQGRTGTKLTRGYQMPRPTPARTASIAHDHAGICKKWDQSPPSCWFSTPEISPHLGASWYLDSLLDLFVYKFLSLWWQILQRRPPPRKGWKKSVEWW